MAERQCEFASRKYPSTAKPEDACLMQRNLQRAILQDARNRDYLILVPLMGGVDFSHSLWTIFAANEKAKKMTDIMTKTNPSTFRTLNNVFIGINQE